MANRFVLNETSYHGKGAISAIVDEATRRGFKKAFLCTDPDLIKFGVTKKVTDILDGADIAYEIYSNIKPNPTIENIEEAKDMYNANGCQGIIAFGGGSPMDCAKIAAARVVKPNQPVEKMRGLMKILRPLPPFFAVPTTAGTGSECTLAAVVSNSKTHEKNACNDPFLRPRFAVFDPELTVGLPPHITSTTGMDALTHAVEAYIGHSNTKQTEKDAIIATKLVFENIETAYKDGKNVEARENMLVASFHAGLAFTRAYVGYVHAIAHNLGGMYNIPHGLANAVILPYVLDYFGETAYKRLAELADVAGVSGAAQGDRDKAKNFIAAVRKLNETMGIPDKFEQIKDEDIQLIAERALMEGNPLYPVPKIMDLEDCKALIKKLQK